MPSHATKKHLVDYLSHFPDDWLVVLGEGDHIEGVVNVDRALAEIEYQLDLADHVSQ